MTTTIAKPGNVAEIFASAETGTTWTERDREYGTCATCKLERPTAAMVLADGRWYCPEPIPGCRP
jgi:hypothetical protein